MRPERVDFMGIDLDPVTLEQAVDLVEVFIDEGGPHEQVSINANKVVTLDRDPALRRMVAHCDLVCADGAGVYLASKVLGVPIPERVAGTDLFLALMARAEQKGWRPYLLGATQEVLDETVAHFREAHPDLELAGARNGYFTPDEERDIAQAIRDSGADLLFVAISSPKKEHFLGRWADTMQVPYMQGVGGSFDVVAGKVDRAPPWLREHHLEWAWRWAQEPRRMWRRNVIGSSTFVLRVLKAKLLGYRVPEAS